MLQAGLNVLSLSCILKDCRGEGMAFPTVVHVQGTQHCSQYSQECSEVLPTTAPSKEMRHALPTQSVSPAAASNLRTVSILVKYSLNVQRHRMAKETTALCHPPSCAMKETDSVPPSDRE